MAVVKFVTLAVGVVVVLLAAPCALAASAFRVVWNAPSQICENCGGLPLENYGIETNTNESFVGSTIACLYSKSFGLWPKLNATLNATPCWTGQKPCSWTPWGSIDVLENGGVPQAANLSLHLEKVAADTVRELPDPEYSGIVILDFEVWRPVLQANYDALSFNIAFSHMLVKKKHPGWNASQVAQAAASNFNAAALAFFVETIRTIRALRPKAKIGYYEWPSDGSIDVDDDLKELYKEVDVMAPSVYPRYTDVAQQANWTAGKIIEAQRVQEKYGRTGSVVMPYTRALVQQQHVLNRGELATQVQIAAGLGTEGIILWGSSADYTNGCDGSCQFVANELKIRAGPVISDCKTNRDECRANHCAGHGRCVDYTGKQLETVCLHQLPVLSCRCDPGWSGTKCNIGKAL